MINEIICSKKIGLYFDIFSLVSFQSITSWYLLRNHSRSDQKNNISINHTEIWTLITYVHINHLMTNQIDILKTSMISMFFNFNVYNNVLIKYITNNSHTVFHQYANQKNRHNISINSQKLRAKYLFNFQLASGLFFLVGCSLSFLISL